MTQTTWIIVEIFAGIALLMVLTALLTRWFGPADRRGPVEILKERYARGELSRAEYHQMAEDLGVTIRQSRDQHALPPDRGMETNVISGRAVDP